MNIGEPFNPFPVFTGIFIPEGLVRAKGISPGAKLAYGRLARYAGQDGRCYPSVGTLASEIGVGDRQAQKYIAELERNRLIRRVSRFSDGGQTSNAFEFLWHSMFEGVNDRSGAGVNDNSLPPVNDSSPKESQIEESQLEESQNSDLDYPPTNRKKRDSRLDVSPLAGCRQYPRLREALADYMMQGEDDERIYPSDRVVVDIMDAAGGGSEERVVGCLRYPGEERGLRPGTKSGPRHFSWFKAVVADYFSQKHEREFVAGNLCWEAQRRNKMSEEEFDTLTEAF